MHEALSECGQRNTVHAALSVAWLCCDDDIIER